MSIEGLNPILTHLGYGFSGKTVLFITWGGLRGAVGLSLALVVADDLPDQGRKVTIATLVVCDHTVNYALLILWPNSICI